MLGAILLLGMTGTGAELFLMGHYDGFEQLIPVVLLGAGIAAVGWHFVAGSPASGTVVRGVMVLFVAAGLTGVYYHLAANLEFQRETDPALREMEAATRVSAERDACGRDELAFAKSLETELLAGTARRHFEIEALASHVRARQRPVPDVGIHTVDIRALDAKS